MLTAGYDAFLQASPGRGRETGAMSENKVNPIPDGYHTITPFIVVNDGAKAIEFYKELFGATELHRMTCPESAQVMHAEIKIRNHVLMLGDENPEMNCYGPLSLNKPSPVSIMIYVNDVDALFSKAVTMGAKGSMPPMDMFWGDRFGKFVDPFGHQWAVATHIKDVTPEEMAKGAEEMFKEKVACV
jgi:PhnB protein